MEDNGIRRSHKIAIDNRKKCVISGVKEVIAFDAQSVILDTQEGILNIKGEELRVNKLSVELGDVDVTGKINALTYTKDNNEKQESLWAKMFR